MKNLFALTMTTVLLVIMVSLLHSTGFFNIMEVHFAYAVMLVVMIIGVLYSLKSHKSPD